MSDVMQDVAARLSMLPVPANQPESGSPPDHEKSVTVGHSPREPSEPRRPSVTEVLIPSGLGGPTGYAAPGGLAGPAGPCRPGKHEAVEGLGSPSRPAGGLSAPGGQYFKPQLHLPTAPAPATALGPTPTSRGPSLMATAFFGVAHGTGQEAPLPAAPAPAQLSTAPPAAAIAAQCSTPPHGGPATTTTAATQFSTPPHAHTAAVPTTQLSTTPQTPTATAASPVTPQDLAHRLPTQPTHRGSPPRLARSHVSVLSSLATQEFEAAAQLLQQQFGSRRSSWAGSTAAGHFACLQHVSAPTQHVSEMPGRAASLGSMPGAAGHPTFARSSRPGQDLAVLAIREDCIKPRSLHGGWKAEDAQLLSSAQGKERTTVVTRSVRMEGPEALFVPSRHHQEVPSGMRKVRASEETYGSHFSTWKHPAVAAATAASELHEPAVATAVAHAAALHDHSAAAISIASALLEPRLAGTAPMRGDSPLPSWYSREQTCRPPGRSAGTVEAEVARWVQPLVQSHQVGTLSTSQASGGQDYGGVWEQEREWRWQQGKREMDWERCSELHSKRDKGRVWKEKEANGRWEVTPAETGGLDSERQVQDQGPAQHVVGVVETQLSGLTQQSMEQERPTWQARNVGQHLQHLQHVQASTEFGSNARYPESGYPEPRYPKPGYPQPTYPEPQHPDSRYPASRQPESVFPELSYPESRSSELQRSRSISGSYKSVLSSPTRSPTGSPPQQVVMSGQRGVQPSSQRTHQVTSLLLSYITTLYCTMIMLCSNILGWLRVSIAVLYYTVMILISSTIARLRSFITALCCWIMALPNITIRLRPLITMLYSHVIALSSDAMGWLTLHLVWAAQRLYGVLGRGGRLRLHRRQRRLELWDKALFGAHAVAIMFAIAAKVQLSEALAGWLPIVCNQLCRMSAAQARSATAQTAAIRASLAAVPAATMETAATGRSAAKAATAGAAAGMEAATSKAAATAAAGIRTCAASLTAPVLPQTICRLLLPVWPLLGGTVQAACRWLLLLAHFAKRVLGLEPVLGTMSILFMPLGAMVFLGEGWYQVRDEAFTLLGLVAAAAFARPGHAWQAARQRLGSWEEVALAAAVLLPVVYQVPIPHLLLWLVAYCRALCIASGATLGKLASLLLPYLSAMIAAAVWHGWEE